MGFQKLFFSFRNWYIVLFIIYTVYISHHLSFWPDVTCSLMLRFCCFYKHFLNVFLILRNILIMVFFIVECFEKSLLIDHCIDLCSVTTPLNNSAAGVDLVLIQTSMLFFCKSSCCCCNAKWYQKRSTPASLLFKHLVIKAQNCKVTYSDSRGCGPAIWVCML